MDIQKQIEKYIYFPDISKRSKKLQGIIKLVTTIKRRPSMTKKQTVKDYCLKRCYDTMRVMDKKIKHLESLRQKDMDKVIKIIDKWATTPIEPVSENICDDCVEVLKSKVKEITQCPNQKNSRKKSKKK